MESKVRKLHNRKRLWRERDRNKGGGSVKLIPSELLGPAAALPLKTVFLFFLFSANLLSPLPLSLLPPVPLAISLPSYPF